MNNLLIKSLCLLIIFSCTQHENKLNIDNYTPQTDDDLMDNKTASDISELFEYLYDNNLFNGVALIYDDDQFLFENSYGLANVEWNISNTIDTKFEIGSVAKQFTAMLILQLAEEDKIDLDDWVSKYIELPNDMGDSITVHQLLTHTSGLPDHSSALENYLTVHAKINYTMNERINQLSNSHLKFRPGIDWSYNGFGYSLLAEIASRITGKSIDSLYYQNIFKPLGMDNSGTYTDSKVISNRAYGYQWNSKGEVIIPEYNANTHAKIGGGGIYSTSHDLLKWYKALYNKTLLSDNSMEKIMSPQYYFLDSTGYSYGFFWDPYICNDKEYFVISHGGSLPGTSSLVFFIPELNQCIILLHNTGMGMEVFLNNIALEILNILNIESFENPALDVIYALAYTGLFDDVENVISQYQYFKSNNTANAYSFYPEQLIIGCQILQQYGKNEGIEEILKFNINEFPDSYSTYIGLGNYYKDKELNNEAKTFYKKALKLTDEDETQRMINQLILECDQ